jgi:tetratricopeptide (TPR) repeat protein
MAIKLNPDYAEAYYDKGLALYSIGEIAETINSYDMTIKLDPNNADAYIAKGIALSNIGNSQEATHSYDKAIKLNTDDAKYYYNKAKVLSNMGHEQEALYWFNKAFELTNKSPSMMMDLSGKNTGYLSSLENNRENLLKQITELQKVTVSTQIVVDGLDHNDPTIRHAIEKFRALKHHKTMITNKIMYNFDKESISPTAFNNHLNGNLQKEIALLQEQIQEGHAEMLLLQSLQNEQSKDIEQVKYKLHDLATGVKSMKLTMESAGVFDKAKVQEGFANLYEQSPKLYEYAKAFYWTLLNYFAAYRSIGTNLVTGNTDIVTSDPEKFMVSGLETVSSYLVDMAVKTTESIPVVGNIIGLLDGVVSSVYQSVKDKRLNDRVAAITSVIMHNKDPKALLEEDISLTIALTALDIALHKQSDILYPKPEHQTKWQQVEEWVDDKINAIKEFALGKGIDVYDSQAAQIALKDTVLLLAYIYKNYAIIINKSEPLSEQFANIIVSGKSDNMLNLNHSAPASPRKTKITITEDINLTEKNPLHNEEFTKFSDAIEIPPKTCCEKTKNFFTTCTISTVYHVKYDNPLLNNPELLKHLATKIPLTKIVNISHKLLQNGYNESLNRAVNNNDLGTLEHLLLLGSETSHFDENA